MLEGDDPDSNYVDENNSGVENLVEVQEENTDTE